MADQPISRPVGIALLLVIATAFGANHVAARVAFEHGASVTTAVAVRSLGTVLFVLFVLALLRWNGIALRPSAPSQILGAFIVVGAITWMGAGKK